MTENPNKLLNEHTAAERLGIKVSTLRAWRVQGSPLPFVKIGRCVRYAADDLAAFIAASKVSSTTELGV